MVNKCIHLKKLFLNHILERSDILKKYIKNIILLSIVFIFIFCTLSYGASDPTIVTKLNSAFKKIRDWMVKLATPAAAVAVGTGVFITKFSFGDDDRIIKGKRLIRTTLYSYFIILAVDLILKAIESLV